MAITPTTNWDETKPAGTRDINLGDDDIRELKTQIREIIAVDHEIAAAGSGADWGKHNIITLLVQAALTTIAGAGRLGSKTVGGIIELFYRDDAGTETQITSNGSVVTPATSIVGEIRGYAGASAPTGWLLCDGSAINRVTYAALFAITGILYGPGDGSTTFNIPDLRGRVPVGKSAADTEFDTLGETGGAKTHVHTIGGTHTHSITIGGATANFSGGPNGHTHGVSVDSPAPGTTSNNGDSLQPYQVVNYIIKT